MGTLVCDFLYGNVNVMRLCAGKVRFHQLHGVLYVAPEEKFFGLTRRAISTQSGCAKRPLMRPTRREFLRGSLALAALPAKNRLALGEGIGKPHHVLW
jgi:hypothetical protein